MMAYEGSESARNNFGKFIHQFQPETKRLIRKLERILIKLYRQNVCLLFNETCLNERLLPIYIYILFINLYLREALRRIISDVSEFIRDYDSFNTRAPWSSETAGTDPNSNCLASRLGFICNLHNGCNLLSNKSSSRPWRVSILLILLILVSRILLARITLISHGFDIFQSIPSIYRAPFKELPPDVPNPRTQLIPIWWPTKVPKALGTILVNSSNLKPRDLSGNSKGS